MAKQKGPHFMTGTIDGICYYKMEGKYYQRRKSSLSGKRVKRSPAFALTMVHAGVMAQASKIASGVYRELPAKKKKHALYRKMTGEAMQLLKKGVDAEAVTTRIQQAYVVCKTTTPARKEKTGRLCVTAGGLLWLDCSYMDATEDGATLKTHHKNRYAVSMEFG